MTVISGWCFGKFMSFTTLQWHFYCGYTVLGLIIFRCLWGFVGPAPIRYRALLSTPSALFAYSKNFGRRSPSGTPGHNPIGSLSVIAMLLLLTAQASSGLFIEAEDFFESAPLSYLVSDAISNQLTWWHKLISKILLGAVGLHVAAIFYYLLWKKENLILPMFTGWKWVKARSESE